MTHSRIMDDANGVCLTPSQQKAVSHREGPLLVIAGPGSGKTRVITHRIAALIAGGVSPHNICAITFTNKAAEEMRQRAVALGASGGAHISTFHSLCVRILRRYGASADIKPNFSIYDERDQNTAVKQALKDCSIDSGNFPPAKTLDDISMLKNRLLTPDSFAGEAGDYRLKIVAKVYARYQDILSEHNALDFDDLLMEAALLLENNRDVSNAMSERFRFLLIDEYQDTNHAQYRIAKALARRHNNICATGDPDQSIYRWRGADIRNILAFEKDWPDATIIKLEENFRSTPNILDAADRLIANNRKRKEKRLVATRPAGSEVTVAAFEDESDEARGVASQIKRLIAEGSSPNQTAVFYRINAQSRSLEEAFIRSKVPYQIVRGVEFYNRKEIRDILGYLKVIVNPADSVALLRIINTPARGIGKTTIDKVHDSAALAKITMYDALKRAPQLGLGPAATKNIAAFVNLLESWRKAASENNILVPIADEQRQPNSKSEIESQKSGVAEITERILTESGLEKFLKAGGTEGKNALENIEELISAAADYDRSTENPSLLDYLQQVALFSDSDKLDTASQTVALMTLHTAKGLEFDNVFIVGVEDGLLPHERSNEEGDDIEEERRLLFVGITRAKTNLFITYARYRTIRGQMLRSRRSDFLYELGLNLSESDSSGPDEDSQIEIPSPARRNSEFPIHSSQFRKGDIVVHRKFGLGTVRQFTDTGESSTVVVAFNTGQTKTLMVKYANLVKM